MIEHNSTDENIPKFSNGDMNPFLDTEAMKIQEGIKLAKSLFTDYLDRELEISDLNDQEIGDIGLLKYFDTILGCDKDNDPVFGQLVTHVIRGKFSKHRQSRKEILDMMKALFQSREENEFNNIAEKSRVRKWLNGWRQ